MNLYAQKMIELANRIGQPQVTETRVQQPREGLDIGNLLMLLSMSDLFGGKKNSLSDLAPVNESQPMLDLVSGGLGQTSPQPQGFAAGIPGEQDAYNFLTPDFLFKLLGLK